MCGIVYGVRKDRHPIAKSILKRFNQQKGRGTQGFGYVGIDENGFVAKIQREETTRAMEVALAGENFSHVLFHHRMPTSTPNIEELNHPITVESDLLDHTYQVVHNGVLRNEDELKETFEAMGFEYTTHLVKREIIEIGGKEESSVVEEYFNDSESLAIDLALLFDGKKTKIDAKGSIAFVCIQSTKEGEVEKVIYGRNAGNPLVVEKNGDLLFIKSTGSGKSIEKDKIYVFDPKTFETTYYDFPIGEYSSTGYTTSPGYERRSSNLTSNWEREYNQQHRLPYSPIPTIDADTRQMQLEDGTSYLTSLQRLDDLKEEKINLEAEIYIGENEMKTENLSYRDEQIYEELLKDSRTKLKEVKAEIKWLTSTLKRMGQL